jgi:hypothetical protein
MNILINPKYAYIHIQEQCRGSPPAGLGPGGPSLLNNNPPKRNKKDNSEDEDIYNNYDYDDNDKYDNDKYDNDNYDDNNNNKKNSNSDKYNDKHDNNNLKNDYKSDSNKDNDDVYITRNRIPVGIALLQSLFADAINDKKYKQGSRIIRLLEYFVECFGYLLLGCSVISVSFIICILTLLIMPFLLVSISV